MLDGVRKLAAAVVAATLLLAVPAAAWGARSNPQLSAQIRGVNDAGMRSEELRIASLDVAVRLHGSIAETTVTSINRTSAPVHAWRFQSS